jgi:hypothetical protein
MSSGGPASVASSSAVTARAAGPVVLGMTLDETRSALAPSYRLRDPENKGLAGSEIVHDEAEIGSPALWVGNSQYLALDGGGREVFRLLTSDESMRFDDPDARVVMVTAVGRGFVTAEGVGPGMTLAAAAAIYGAPELQDDDPEGLRREWAVFPGAPQGVRFAVAAPDGRLAGVYDSGGTATRVYRPGSTIQSVVIGARR